MSRFGQSKGNEINVQVFRDGLRAPWGFRLQGGLDYESPLTVQRVVPLSAVDGSLLRGDIITKIDDYDATRMTHDAALDLIATAGSSIRLSILRKPGAVSGTPYRNTRSISTPIQFASRLSPTQEIDEDGADHPKLADIMKESLKYPRERIQYEPIRSHGYSRPTTPSFSYSSRPTTPSFNYTPNPNVDITSYLPRPPPKRVLQHRNRDSERLRHQVRDSLLSPMSSGRSSPTGSSVIELGSPADAARPVAVWTPPVQKPHSKLVHLQYNSPMSVYSSYNVADTVEKMTGSKLQWLNQPPTTRYLDDIRDSPTYKFVQELEGRSQSKPIGPYEQSGTIKNLNRYFGIGEMKVTL